MFYIIFQKLFFKLQKPSKTTLIADSNAEIRIAIASVLNDRSQLKGKHLKIYFL